MSGVVSGFVILISVVLLGLVLGRLRMFDAAATQVLSRLAVYVATPALLFSTLAVTDVQAIFSGTLLATSGSIALMALLVVLVSRLALHRSVSETTINTMSATYVNAGNLGIPVTAYVLGDPSLVAPVLLFQVLVMSPVGLGVLDLARTGGGGSLLRVVTQPLRTPITVAVGLGVLISSIGVRLPELVMRPVELVGATAVPVALIAYGLSLYGSPRPAAGKTRPDVILVVLVKVVLQPAVAYLLGRFAFGLDDRQLLAVAVTSALPTAQNIFVYAATYGRGTTVARDTVLLTTVLSLPALLLIATVAG